MDVIAARLEKQYPSNAGIGIRLVTMHEELVGDVKRPLLILLGAVFAIIGTYGVIAHATAQRTLEIGIRIALGADRQMILRMVLSGGLRIAATGLAIGVFGALALTHVLSGLLFGVGARDPLTFVIVPGALLVVALAACWIPARRAMRVEPVIALRGEA